MDLFHMRRRDHKPQTYSLPSALLALRRHNVPDMEIALPGDTTGFGTLTTRSGSRPFEPTRPFVRPIWCWRGVVWALCRRPAHRTLWPRSVHAHGVVRRSSTEGCGSFRSRRGSRPPGGRTCVLCWLCWPPQSSQAALSLWDHLQMPTRGTRATPSDTTTTSPVTLAEQSNASAQSTLTRVVSTADIRAGHKKL
jgi:hypothetical protein